MQPVLPSCAGIIYFYSYYRYCLAFNGDSLYGLLCTNGAFVRPAWCSWSDLLEFPVRVLAGSSTRLSYVLISLQNVLKIVSDFSYISLLFSFLFLYCYQTVRKWWAKNIVRSNNLSIFGKRCRALYLPYSASVVISCCHLIAWPRTVEPAVLIILIKSSWLQAAHCVWSLSAETLGHHSSFFLPPWMVFCTDIVQLSWFAAISKSRYNFQL